MKRNKVQPWYAVAAVAFFLVSCSNVVAPPLRTSDRALDDSIPSADLADSSSNSPDWGPGVLVFDPSMSSDLIQSRIDSVFHQMESNQFGTERYALLFKPGKYNNRVDVGFYTSVVGLGQSPDDVELKDLRVDAGWLDGNATQNFWRSAENLSTTSGIRWAVAQAAPFRRMHIRGDLILSPTGFGWASGGYIADSKVEGGGVFPYSQQQWLTRNSEIAGWSNAVWNMVFLGVDGAPDQSFPTPPYTTIEQTPIVQEKPFLTWDEKGDYSLFVPDLKTNSKGISWTGGLGKGKSIPLKKFFVAKPSDSVEKINRELKTGKHLILTPGIYHLSSSIVVGKSNSIVFGLGYPTLIPDHGNPALIVDDVDGVNISGLLFDAGETNSSVLMQVGSSGCSSDHSKNPNVLQDLFFRVGGAGVGKATTSLVLNANDTIVDHVWAWRADHGSGIGWTTNTADTGVVVNASDVTAYGLFVEHYQKNNVVWSGENGKTIFFQNEMPYDVPAQSAWMDGTKQGYAAYKVSPWVRKHEAWGLGSYCFFNVDPTIVAARGFESPTRPKVQFHDLLTVSLGGFGIIEHVINDTGDPAQGGATIPSYLVSYP